MNKKVIFLGAGASNDAGYPLTSELYNKLKTKLEKSQICNYKDAWEKFSSHLEGIKNNYKDFENCENLEYLITITSLLQTLHVAMNSCSLAQAYEGATIGFAECLNFFLGYINFEMKNDAYQYLSDFFKEHLSTGDTVITTNYDLLIERTLNDLEMWHIYDGYGFTVELKENLNYSSIFSKVDAEHKKDLREYKSKKSPIKILKLHGSVGWLRKEDKIVIDTSSLKNILPASMQDYRDKQYDPTLHRNQHLILPSFIKNYDHKTLLNIWAQAISSISKAKEIHVVGFSLPDYDTNIKTIFLLARKNLIAKKCKIKVYILRNDTDTQERWENFLGNNVEIIVFDSFSNYMKELT